MIDTIEIVKDGVVKITHEGNSVELPFELVLCAADTIIERNVINLKEKSGHVEKGQYKARIQPECVGASDYYFAERLSDLEEGFWINSHSQFTKGLDGKYWIPPSQIVFIEKES